MSIGINIRYETYKAAQILNAQLLWVEYRLSHNEVIQIKYVLQLEIYYLLKKNCCWFYHLEMKKIHLLEAILFDIETASYFKHVVTDQIWNQKFLRLNLNNLIFQIGTKPYAYGLSYFRLYVFKCGNICSYNVTKVFLILTVLLRFLPIFPSLRVKAGFLIIRNVFDTNT